MAIDGSWKITVNSPMGVQEATLALATSGDTLTGTQTGSFGTQQLVDGRVEGNTASWKASINAPFPLTLEYAVTIDGDKMTGSVKAGAFGSSPLQGQRA
jgi:hypothetical protein